MFKPSIPLPSWAEPALNHEDAQGHPDYSIIDYRRKKVLWSVMWTAGNDEELVRFQFETAKKLVLDQLTMDGPKTASANFINWMIDRKWWMLIHPKLPFTFKQPPHMYRGLQGREIERYYQQRERKARYNYDMWLAAYKHRAISYQRFIVCAQASKRKADSDFDMRPKKRIKLKQHPARVSATSMLSAPGRTGFDSLVRLINLRQQDAIFAMFHKREITLAYKEKALKEKEMDLEKKRIELEEKEAELVAYARGLKKRKAEFEHSLVSWTTAFKLWEQKWSKQDKVIPDPEPKNQNPSQWPLNP
jgi:hypothetical protein